MIFLADRLSAPAFGSTLDVYLLRRFVGAFCATLAVVILLHLMSDVFGRVDNLMGYDATFSNAVRFFLYRLPLMISRSIGFAALFAAFLCLGALARRNELVAAGACGISLHRITVPLLLASLAISAGTFLWNETTVPLATRQAKFVYDVKVRNAQLQSVFHNRQIWIRSGDSFIRADDFDAEAGRLRGLSIYRTTPRFTLTGLIESPAALWDGNRWVPEGGTEWRFLDDGTVERHPLGGRLALNERPDDFRVFTRSPDEFSYAELKERIQDLRRKGVDTLRDTVNLHTKVAVPLAIPITILLAMALAVKPGRKDSIALNLALSAAIGFSYWVLLGFCVSLGRAGAIQPWVAAWLPNMVMGSVSLFLYAGSE